MIAASPPLVIIGMDALAGDGVVHHRTGNTGDAAAGLLRQHLLYAQLRDVDVPEEVRG